MLLTFTNTFIYTISPECTGWMVTGIPELIEGTVERLKKSNKHYDINDLLVYHAYVSHNISSFYIVKH